MRRPRLRRDGRYGSSARPIEDDGLAVEELRGGQLANELLLARQADLAGHAVERRVMVLSQQLDADAKRIDAERIQAVEVDRVAELRARVNHHRRVVGLQQPWHVDEAHQVEVVRGERAGPAGADLRRRVKRERIAKVRPHGAGTHEVKREENHVGDVEVRRMTQLVQAYRVVAETEFGERGAAEPRELLEKRLSHALTERRVIANDECIAAAVVNRETRDLARFELDRQPKQIQPRRLRRARLERIEGERRDGHEIARGEYLSLIHISE